MPQENILKKIADFLELQTKKRDPEGSGIPGEARTPNDGEWISHTTKLITVLRSKGFCHGLSLCYGTMRHLDNVLFPSHKNLERWQKILDAINEWDGHTDPDKIYHNLPLPNPEEDGIKSSDKETDEKTPTQKISLSQIFEEATSSIIYNQAEPGGSGPIPPDHHNNFKLSESEVKKNSLVQNNRFELSIPRTEAKTSGKNQILHVKHRYSMAGHFDKDHKDEEVRTLLVKSLDQAATKRHISQGICILNAPEVHSCNLWYDEIKKTWWLYDPNYKDDSAHCFSTTEDLVEEIHRILGNDLTLEILHLYNPSIEEEPFLAFKKAIKSPKQAESLSQMRGLTGISCAATWAIPDILDSLKSELPLSKIHEYFDQNLRIFHYLLINNDPVVLKKVMDLGIKGVKEKSLLNYSLSFMAGLDAFKSLLEIGVDLLEKDNLENTLLHTASQHDNVDGVKRLLALHADVHAKNLFGYTPLHNAVSSSNINPELIKALIAAGADMNEKDTYGSTAWEISAQHGTQDFIRTLISGSENQTTITTTVPEQEECKKSLLPSHTETPVQKTSSFKTKSLIELLEDDDSDDIEDNPLSNKALEDILRCYSNEDSDSEEKETTHSKLSDTPTIMTTEQSPGSFNSLVNYPGTFFTHKQSQNIIDLSREQQPSKTSRSIVLSTDSL